MATVRRVSFGTGVEITVPLHSPAISKIEIVKQAKVRQSKAILSSRKRNSHFKIENKRTGKICGGRRKEKNRDEIEAAEQPKEEADENTEEQGIDFDIEFISRSRGAGIGRRASLRGWCPLGRGSSSLPTARDGR